MVRPFSSEWHETQLASLFVPSGDLVNNTFPLSTLPLPPAGAADWPPQAAVTRATSRRTTLIRLTIEVDSSHYRCCGRGALAADHRHGPACYAGLHRRGATLRLGVNGLPDEGL